MLTRITTIITILLLAIPTAFAASGVNGVQVQEPWARPSMGGTKTSAAYMYLVNPTNESDVLMEVKSPQARKAELHKTVTDDKGVDHMVRIDKIVIPAGQQVDLAPKGLHIMLFNLKEVLVPGDKIRLQLSFEKTGVVEVTVPVKAMAVVEVPAKTITVPADANTVVIPETSIPLDNAK
jgi:copper(I)-binding protein